MTKRMKRILIAGISAALAVTLIVLSVVFAVKMREKREYEERLRLFEEYRNMRIEDFRRENAEYADGEVDVAFIGDSLTDGYDVKAYYPSYVVSNRGISGDTTVGLEARLDVSLFELQPKVVVMLIGANNMDTMLDNYEDILIKMKENLPNSEIIIVSLTSMGGDSWGKKNQLAAFNNHVIKSLAEEHGLRFVDMFTPLLDNDTHEIRAEYTTDGGHLTSSGYRVFTETLKPVIVEAVEKYSSKPAP